MESKTEKPESVKSPERSTINEQTLQAIALLEQSARKAPMPFNEHLAAQNAANFLRKRFSIAN